jgi:hypothetical protein
VVNEKGLVVREGVVDSVPEAIAGFVRSKAPGAGACSGTLNRHSAIKLLAG